MHRDISFSNLLLTRPSSSELAVGLLIDFDYAQHLKFTSDETVVTTGNSSPNALNTHTSAESSPSPNVTSVESSGGLIPTHSSSISKSAAGGPQAPSIPDGEDANTDHTVSKDAGKDTGITGLRTVSLIFFR